MLGEKKQLPDEEEPEKPLNTSSSDIILYEAVALRTNGSSGNNLSADSGSAKSTPPKIISTSIGAVIGSAVSFTGKKEPGKEPESAGGSTRVYWKNLAGLSLGIMFSLVAYNSLFFVQSSLHGKSAVGTTALAVDYSAQVISCAFMPKLLMQTVGYKWTLLLAIAGIASYVAANMYAFYETMLPAALLMGLGFAAMWATMNTIVTQLATGYAEVTGTKPNTAISRFFGIFYMVIEQAKIWGNLLSSTVLAPPSSSHEGVLNASRLEVCGGNYCNQRLSGYTGGDVFNATSNTTVASESRVSDDQKYLLSGIALSFCAIGVVFILLLVDSRDTIGGTRHTTDSLGATVREHVFATIKMMADPNLLMLIIITIGAGLVQSFYVSDITKALFTCALGIHNVGRITICYGVVLVLGSLSMGYVVQLVGRLPLIVLAVLLHVADILLILYWRPDPESVFVFYLIAILWALAVCIWIIQLTALYGQVFQDRHEEAYSNHRLWECVGFAVGFGWTTELCIATKMYVILGFLVVGLAGYLATELRFWLQCV